jgi:NAD(P)-dependent dehydrogenase (short-subunit alcohol dehydrogenase family)
MAKVWFITGSSRGLGRSLTAAVLANGDLVAATARKPEQLSELAAQYPEQILALPLDVTKIEEIDKAIADTIRHFGRIDVLVNNAGFGITGAAEAFTDDQVKMQLEADLYGPIEITRAVLPYMRKQRSGRVLQISSVGGRIGNAGLSIYSASKFALAGFTEAVSKEVAPLGIKLTSIEPGGFRTDWAGASMTYAKKVEGYEVTVDKAADYFRNEYEPKGDPEKAAQVMIRLVEHPEPPMHLVLGSEAASLLEKADEARQAEFKKWRAITDSTDFEQ